MSNEGKMNSSQFDMTYSKEFSKNENVGQTYLKKHLNYTILVKYCVMAISRNSNRFLMSIERIVKVIKIIKVYEIISIQL